MIYSEYFCSTLLMNFIYCRTHILPICMPSIPIDIVGKSGHIAGWGKITQEHGHTGTNILRTASVPIISKNECIKWHEKKNIHVELFDEMICAGYKNKTVDACLGDRLDN